MIPMKKESQVLQKERRLDLQERRKRDRGRNREKVVCRGLHKRNTSPKPLTGKTRVANYHKFYKQETESLKF